MSVARALAVVLLALSSLLPRGAVAAVLDVDFDGPSVGQVCVVGMPAKSQGSSAPARTSLRLKETYVLRAADNAWITEEADACEPSVKFTDKDEAAFNQMECRLIGDGGTVVLGLAGGTYEIEAVSGRSVSLRTNIQTPRVKVLGGDYETTSAESARDVGASLQVRLHLKEKCSNHYFSSDLDRATPICVQVEGAHQLVSSGEPVRLPRGAKSSSLAVCSCATEDSCEPLEGSAEPCSCTKPDLQADPFDLPPPMIPLRHKRVEFAWKPSGSRAFSSCPSASVNSTRCAQGSHVHGRPGASFRVTGCAYTCELGVPTTLPVSIDWSHDVACEGERHQFRWTDRLSENGDVFESYAPLSENRVCVSYPLDSWTRNVGWRNQVTGLNVTLPTGRTLRVPVGLANETASQLRSHWLAAENVSCGSPLTYQFEGRRQFSVERTALDAHCNAELKPPRELRARSFSFGFAAGGGVHLTSLEGDTSGAPLLQVDAILNIDPPLGWHPFFRFLIGTEWRASFIWTQHPYKVDATAGMKERTPEIDYTRAMLDWLPLRWDGEVGYLMLGPSIGYGWAPVFAQDLAVQNALQWGARGIIAARFSKAFSVEASARAGLREEAVRLRFGDYSGDPNAELVETGAFGFLSGYFGILLRVDDPI